MRRCTARLGWATALALIAAGGCTGASNGARPGEGAVETAVSGLVEGARVPSGSAIGPAERSPETADDGSSGASPPTVDAAHGAAGADSGYDSPHDAGDRRSFDAGAAGSIALSGRSIAAEGPGVSVEGTTVTIGQDGAYVLRGTLDDGGVVVDCGDCDVTLILDGVDLTSTTSPPILVAGADEVVLALADGSTNSLRDGPGCGLADGSGNASSGTPNAALYSRADLTIVGGGTLHVSGRCNDGITSTDGLAIRGGTLLVEAVDDGIRGKDYVVMRGGDVTVRSGGDGVKSDDDQDPARGYVRIEGGTLEVEAVGDAVTAQTQVRVDDGRLTLRAGGGSASGGYDGGSSARGRTSFGGNSGLDETVSAKAVKGLESVLVLGGQIDIDAADDAVHSNGMIRIEGGSFDIATGDDAFHADDKVTVTDGRIAVSTSYEGIESAVIEIQGGEIAIVSSDDGLNVAGGNDGSGMGPGFGRGMRPRPGGGPGQDAFAAAGDYLLRIEGGYVVVRSDGDGMDVNGAVEMGGGTLILHGPTREMDSALDFDAGFDISGGTLIAVGSAGMAQAPSESSSQRSAMVNYPTPVAAATLFHVRTAAGDAIVTFRPEKAYQSIVFSSPQLIAGESFELLSGGEASGPATDGLYEPRSYTAGQVLAGFETTGAVTVVGDRARRRWR